MNILVIGNGGREHALAWKLAQSPLATHIFVAPGNAGTAAEPNVTNVAIAAENIPALLEFAQEKSIDLTVVGPEAPLVAGIVDTFQEAGLACFGPTAAAAQLEGSKSFSKDFLARHAIPTARYDTFTETQQAIDYAQQQKTPIVIKADGLAAGKGVIIAQTHAEAIAAITDMLSDNRFGDAGSRVVIEEFIEGEEASFIVIADGKNALSMATSQDHKALLNGDKGPNTGGMGACSPAPIVTPEITQRIIDEVIQPTIQGMASENMPFTGFLYAGLMITPEGELKVLEYNVRFGDPETQPIMCRLESDLVSLIMSALSGQLEQQSIQWDSRKAVGIVLAAGGYPDSYQKGDMIHGLPDLKEQKPLHNKVFHAGTALADNSTEVLTNGGRVLCAVALGETIHAAQKNAYALTRSISWNNVYYRDDIAHHAIAHEQRDN